MSSTASDCPTPDTRAAAMIGARGPGGRRFWPRLLWLPFLLIPVVDLLGSSSSPLRIGLGLGGFAIYVALGFNFIRDGLGGSTPRRLLPAIVFLTAEVAALCLFERPSWGTLFPALAVAASRLRESWRLPGVLIMTAVAELSCLPAGGSGALATSGSTFGVGLMMLGMRRLAETNMELHAARAELAETAVAQERERFARDLHDLLGHSLSVIALKAELAGRLLPERTAEAQTHVRELEGVARDALREVRDAVSGYHRPALAAELQGARMALEAAGITLDSTAPQAALPADVEAVLAWTVREGTTNVIRHSGARQVRIVAGREGSVARVAIEDDGAGMSAGVGGHGIAGLRERASALDGRVHVGPRADGSGFRLQVTVPLGREALPA